MSAVVYPISGCWIWNANGWLAQLGFHDFAGGTAVHLLGGSVAFAGAAVLGARIGKYDKRKSQGLYWDRIYLWRLLERLYCG